MIAKNEEDNIERCINSYKNIVQEIIVVDTGSTDSTMKIAKKMGARVFDYKWNDNFADARNYAISKAKGRWIIFLDADEYFDEKSVKIIPGILEKIIINKMNCDCLGCRIVNIEKSTSKVINSFANIRIFRNRKDIKYKNPIHEVLFKTSGKIKTWMLYDQIKVYHTGYSNNISKAKCERNLNILLSDIKANGDNPDYYRYLSDCYKGLGNYEEAIKYAKLHIESGIKLIGYNSKMYKNIIDSLYMMRASNSEIEKAIKTAIDKFPEHPNFHFYYGCYLFKNKRYEESLVELQYTIKYHDDGDYIETDFTEGEINQVYSRIGHIYELRNDEEKAIENYYKSLRIDKYTSNDFSHIVRIIKDQPLKDIIALINSIYDIKSKSDMKFVIDNLIKLKVANILLYYTNIWYKDFNQEDSALLFTLLSIGRYNSAFNIFFKGYLQDYSCSNAMFSMVSAICSRNADNMNQLIQYVKPSFKRILNNFMGNSQISFIDEDIEDYLSVLSEIVVLNNKDIIDSYIGLKQYFSKDISCSIGNILKSNNLFEMAIEQYEQYLKNVDNAYENSAIITELCGYCYYRLKNYMKAVEYFEKSLSLDCNENDIYCYLNWICEQANDVEINKKVERLKNLYKPRTVCVGGNIDEFKKEN